jgi:Tn3 transposase DDE domain
LDFLKDLQRRRNILAALIAIGCNLGPQRMAVASGLSVREISEVADWYLTEDALKAASIDLVNYASNLPLSPIYGRGASCSADGLRFYVPLNLLAADYSHVLRDRGELSMRTPLTIVKTHAIVHAWDQVVRMIASLQQRIVSPSLVLHRLGSYARQVFGWMWLARDHLLQRHALLSPTGAQGEPGRHARRGISETGFRCRMATHQSIRALRVS